MARKTELVRNDHGELADVSIAALHLKRLRDGLPGSWHGLETREFAAASDLPPGTLRWSENLIARSGGSLGIRPGFVGQLAATLGGAITTSIEFAHAGGSALIVAVAGQGIYRWEFAANAATQISGAVDFGNCEAVNFARLDAWVFISGAVDGKLYRYDGATFEAATGLLAPTQAITATATNRGTLVNPAADLSRWRSRWVSAPANLISEAESLFPAGSAIRTDSTGATTGNVMAGLNPPGGTACIELQPNAAGATEYSQFTPFALPVTVADFLTSGAPAADGGRADFARSTYFVAAEDTLSLYPGGFSTVDAFSNFPGTVALPAARARLDHGELSKDTPTFASLLWDGRGRGAASIRSRWEYTGLDTAKGIDVTRAGLAVFGQKFAVTNVGDWAEVRQGSYPAENGRVLLTGAWLEYQLAAAAAWSPGRAYIALAVPAGVASCLVRVSISDGTASHDVGTLNVAPGQTDYELDFSTAPAAVLAAVLRVRLTFLADVPVLGASDAANSIILNVGAIYDAGPLSVGLAAYQWRVVERLGGLSSPAGVASAAVAPSQKNATGKLVLSALATNAGALLDFYRVGGVLGEWRKVASVAMGANSSGPGWSWNHAAKTFLDFTSDESLVTADILEDHQGPPTNARAIATYARRLAVLTDTELWLSRAEVGAAAGLYYDTANDPGAANYSEQGAVFTSISAAGLVASPGAALRLVAWDNRLVAFFASAVLALTGQSPAEFSLLAMEYGTGGLLSRRAVCVHLQRLVWLSAVGVMSLSPGAFIGPRGDGERRGELIRLAGEISGATSIGGETDAEGGMGAALAASSLWSADGRLYWAMPNYLTQPAHPAIASALSGLPVVFVLLGEKGWYAWRTAAAIRGGAVVSGRRGFVALGANGQLFRVADSWGDKALSGSAAAAVAFTALSAWRGDADIVHRILSAGFSGRATAQVNLTIQAWSLAGLWTAGTWKIPAGNIVVSPRRVRLDRVIRGARVSWGISGSAAGDLAFGDVELHATEGGLYERA